MVDDFTTALKELEQVLVRQFKLLNQVIAVTKKERSSLLNDPDAVLTVVEEKESLLDSMTLLEDACRKLVQEISLAVELHSPETSIQALLPFFDPDAARRVRNLSDGISNLADQARELTRANQAIALTRLDWLKETQSFLLSVVLPEAGYQKPGSGVARQD